MNRDRVAGLVIHENKVLLMFRRNHGKEYYTFPGGGIEPGESLEQAVERELWEETSLRVRPRQCVYDVEWDGTTHQRFYLADYVSGTPTLGDFVEKDVMKSDKNQYYEPCWKELQELPKLLVYPLEIKEWFLSDISKGWPKKEKSMHLLLATCRQS